MRYLARDLDRSAPVKWSLSVSSLALSGIIPTRESESPLDVLPLINLLYSEEELSTPKRLQPRCGAGPATLATLSFDSCGIWKN
jgi:hypothetical protein